MSCNCCYDIFRKQEFCAGIVTRQNKYQFLNGERWSSLESFNADRNKEGNRLCQGCLCQEHERFLEEEPDLALEQLRDGYLNHNPHDWHMYNDKPKFLTDRYSYLSDKMKDIFSMKYIIQNRPLGLGIQWKGLGEKMGIEIDHQDAWPPNNDMLCSILFPTRFEKHFIGMTDKALGVYAMEYKFDQYVAKKLGIDMGGLVHHFCCDMVYGLTTFKDTEHLKTLCSPYFGNRIYKETSSNELSEEEMDKFLGFGETSYYTTVMVPNEKNNGLASSQKVKVVLYTASDYKYGRFTLCEIKENQYYVLVERSYNLAGDYITCKANLTDVVLNHAANISFDWWWEECEYALQQECEYALQQKQKQFFREYGSVKCGHCGDPMMTRLCRRYFGSTYDRSWFHTRNTICQLHRFRHLISCDSMFQNIHKRTNYVGKCCDDVYFCSKACQRKAWKSHKQVCRNPKYLEKENARLKSRIQENKLKLEKMKLNETEKMKLDDNMLKFNALPNPHIEIIIRVAIGEAFWNCLYENLFDPICAYHDKFVQTSKKGFPLFDMKCVLMNLDDWVECVPEPAFGINPERTKDFVNMCKKKIMSRWIINPFPNESCECDKRHVLSGERKEFEEFKEGMLEDYKCAIIEFDRKHTNLPPDNNWDKKPLNHDGLLSFLKEENAHTFSLQEADNICLHLNEMNGPTEIYSYPKASWLRKLNHWFPLMERIEDCAKKKSKEVQQIREQLQHRINNWDELGIVLTREQMRSLPVVDSFFVKYNEYTDRPSIEEEKVTAIFADDKDLPYLDVLKFPWKELHYDKDGFLVDRIFSESTILENKTFIRQRMLFEKKKKKKKRRSSTFYKRKAEEKNQKALREKAKKELEEKQKLKAEAERKVEIERMRNRLKQMEKDEEESRRKALAEKRRVHQAMEEEEKRIAKLRAAQKATRYYAPVQTNFTYKKAYKKRSPTAPVLTSVERTKHEVVKTRTKREQKKNPQHIQTPKKGKKQPQLRIKVKKKVRRRTEKKKQTIHNLIHPSKPPETYEEYMKRTKKEKKMYEEFKKHDSLRVKLGLKTITEVTRYRLINTHQEGMTPSKLRRDILEEVGKGAETQNILVNVGHGTHINQYGYKGVMRKELVNLHQRWHSGFGANKGKSDEFVFKQRMMNLFGNRLRKFEVKEVKFGRALDERYLWIQLLG